MAGRGGRGRGRGRGSSFAADVLGLGRGGDPVPPPTAQPPPLFPPLEFSPAPLPQSEGDEYMFLLKQEFRGYMRDSPYHIKPLNKKKDIERYSDKYQIGSSDNGIGWEPYWKRFPKELKIAARKVRRPPSSSTSSSLKPSVSGARNPQKNKEDVIKKLEELEQKEDRTKSGGEEEEEEDEEGEGGEDDEEYYDEEEQEEGTDYISNYFDPGDDYLDEDDGLDDGPTY